jgi:hypothetical protein
MKITDLITWIVEQLEAWSRSQRQRCRGTERARDDDVLDAWLDDDEIDASGL